MFPVIVIVCLLGFITFFLCIALALKVILWPFRALSRPSERKHPPQVL
jgi:hypothetical protein